MRTSTLGTLRYPIQRNPIHIKGHFFQFLRVLNKAQIDEGSFRDLIKLSRCHLSLISNLIFRESNVRGTHIVVKLLRHILQVGYPSISKNCWYILLSNITHPFGLSGPVERIGKERQQVGTTWTNPCRRWVRPPRNTSDQSKSCSAIWY